MLLDIIRRKIADHGPITVADYMTMSLAYPDEGYYMRRDPFGRTGDFVTAPEVSQMFGELIGLWCVVVWQTMGFPKPVTLCELGPGRGTLMADMLRTTTRAAPAFTEAVRVHLVETSPVLRDLQRRALAKAALSREILWHEDLGTVPEGPLLLVANELFDALPIHQYVRSRSGWRERGIGLDDDGARLVFVEVDGVSPRLPSILENVMPGSIVENCPAGCTLMADIGARVARWGGAALVIDYGHTASAPGDTLQSLRRHAFNDVLDHPGEADLTAHVDFQSLSTAATDSGAFVYGPVEQGLFLGRLGIQERARILAEMATATQKRDIEAALYRLAHPREMGTLFKAMAIVDPRLPTPPGFDARQRNFR